MSYPIKNISDNQKELQTDKMKVPAVFLTGQKIREEILEQVEKVAESNRISEVAILSDVHQKKNVFSPEGSVVISDNSILPQMLDTALNCGMRIIKTDIKEDEMTPEKISELFSALKKNIPTRTYFGEIIPYSLAKKVLIQGSLALKNHFSFRIKNEIENTYAQGNFFNVPSFQKFSLAEEDIFQVIPEIFVKMSRYRYGILGATDSHSVMLCRIDSIVDEVVAEKLGIKKGQYVLTMHTGSGIIGRYIAYLYSPQKQRLAHKIPVEIGKFLFNKKAKEKYSKIEKELKNFKNDPNNFGFDIDSQLGKMCLQAYLMAGNVGFANRAVIADKIDKVLENVLGRNVNLELLYDAPHVFLDREKEKIIHRNGAVPAHKDEPVYIAPFQNTFGYLGMGTGENPEAFDSANHEIGKLEDIDQKFLESFSENKYEFYAEVMAKEMEENKLIKLAAKIKPIATLSY